MCLLVFVIDFLLKNCCLYIINHKNYEIFSFNLNFFMKMDIFIEMNHTN